MAFTESIVNRTNHIGFFSAAVNVSFLSNSTSTIATKLDGPQWSFMPIFRLIVGPTAFTSNAVILLVFLTHRSLLSAAFNLYLINLLTCNALYALLQNPADILNGIYPNGWRFGSAYCSAYMYFSWTFEAGMRTCHSLITFNRLWAVLWPNSYRIHHSHKTAFLSILGSWIIVNACLLPGLINDALYYRIPLDINPCRLNTTAQRGWSITVQFLVFDSQVLIMVFAYPVIYSKRRQRMKIDSRPQGAVKTDDQQSKETEFGATQTSLDTRYPARRGAENRPETRKRSSGAFRVLTILTISVAVCWTPLIVYSTIFAVAPTALVLNRLLWGILSVILSLQSAMDPVLFVVALSDLRQAFLRSFRIWHR